MFNIPFLSSVSELISGTVNDEFRRLIRPQPLVSAGLFLALNLVLIFPELLERRIAFAVALAGLSTLWQGVLGTLALLILGYLIASLGSVFVSLVSGSALRNSQLIGSYLRSRQRHVYDDLCARVRTGWLADQPANQNNDPKLREREKREGARAAYRLAFEFPDDRNVIAPTRLGNVLVNASSYTINQYGVHLDTIWPIMEQSLSTANPDLKTRLRENLESLTFLASVAVLLVIVAIEALLLVRPLRTPSLQLVAAVSLIPLAYMVYAAAVQKALSWNRDIRLIFDLYLDTVAKQLSLHELPTEAFADRKTRWEGMSTWLAYGATDIPEYGKPQREPTWYTEKVLPPPHIQHPAALKVASWSSPHWRVWEDSTEEVIWSRGIEYLLTVTYEPVDEHRKHEINGYLLVVDDRLFELPPTVEGRLIKVGSDAWGFPIVGYRQSSISRALLWSLEPMPPGGTRVLMYAVPDAAYEIAVTLPPTTLRIVKLYHKNMSIIVEAQNQGPTALSDALLILRFGQHMGLSSPQEVFYRLAEGPPEGKLARLEYHAANWIVRLPLGVEIPPQVKLSVWFEFAIVNPHLARVVESELLAEQ